MNELGKLISNLIGQLPNIIDTLSEDEFKLVQETLSLARKRFMELKTTEEERMPRGAEFLYVLSGGNPQVFQQYAKQFPDANLNKLAKNKTALTNILQRLESTVQLAKGQEGGIPQADLQSSTVYGSRYDPRTKKLFVKFQGDGVYKYDNVPNVVASLMQNGLARAKTQGRNNYGTWWKGKQPSLGAALNEYIKKAGYNYTKIA